MVKRFLTYLIALLLALPVPADAAYYLFTRRHITAGPNCGLLDLDCSDLTGWTDGDVINGVSSQAAFDFRETFKFDSGAAAAGSYARRSRDIGSLNGHVYFTFTTYADNVGTYAATNYFVLQIHGDEHRFEAKVCSDGFYIKATEVGANIVVQDSWQTWKLDWDQTNHNVTVYLNDVEQGTVGSLTDATSGNGTIYISQTGYTVANCITYLDSLCIGDSW